MHYCSIKEEEEETFYNVEVTALEWRIINDRSLNMNTSIRDIFIIRI